MAKSFTIFFQAYKIYVGSAKSMHFQFAQKAQRKAFGKLKAHLIYILKFVEMQSRVSRACERFSVPIQ